MEAKDIIQTDQNLPDVLYIIPLLGKPIFPGIFTPIMITSDDDKELVEKAMEADNTIGLVLTREDDQEKPASDDLFQVGTAAKIVKKIKLPDGSLNIFITTVKRFITKDYINENTPFLAKVDYIEDITHGPDEELKALTRSLLQEMKELSQDNPLFTEEMRLNMVNIDNPGKIADFIASILNVDRLKQQKILETFNVRNRIEQVLVFMKNEQHLIKLQKKVAGEINDRIEKNQREYFLREELKEIKRELGEPSDARSSEYQKYKERIDELAFEGEVKEQVESELEKFAIMEPQSSEYIVTRNYLDTIVNLPWEAPEPDNVDLEKGEKILNRDHYGLEDVKERILEYLAVRKLKNDSKGSIVLLVGPPGVGKTSIGKSIADTLNRKFFRFSV
ncbi:MAG: LON peptidase substrate-binding domain-containing protein, partial [Spirochaetales bacterium]|nr:LON peptidase substrate-binding domain-containing protein [Spirochaetales bacterium]